MMSALESCRWVRTQLPRFLDCELPTDLAARVSVHLERCGGCRSSLAAERDALIETISALVPAEPPTGLLDSVMAEIEEETVRVAEPVAATSEAPIVRLPSFLPGLAAAALLGFVLWAIPGETEGDVQKNGSPLAKVTTVTGSSGEIGRGGALPGDSRFDPSNGIAPKLASGNTVTFASAAASGLLAEVPPLLLGDVDANGRFDQRDVKGMLGHLDTGGDLPCLAAGDFDDDGAITPADSSLALMSFGGADATASQQLFNLNPDSGLSCAYIACP